jgi:rhodanese-related sulfurtransferase
MERIKRFLLFLLFLSTSAVFSQRAITNADYLAWVSGQVDFILFDVRGDHPVDSVLSPCFYVSSTDAIKWADSLGCRKRLLIICHTGVLAAQTADSVVRRGYPADSVFSGGYGLLTATRYPAADTLPVAFLGTGGVLPQNLSSYQLWAVLLSKRTYMMIDVRSVAEVASGLIPGACNIVWPSPFQTSSALFGKSADIILNCASGNRAGQARTYLISQGFDSTRVINFGGFSKWSGTPGVYVSPAPSQTCECVGVECATFSAGGLRKNLVLSGTVAIFDIRGCRVLTAAEGGPLRFKGWPRGIYIAEYRGERGPIFRRFVVM